MRLARQLLFSGHVVAEAALLADFADQSYMTRACRRQLGIIHARYRAALPNGSAAIPFKTCLPNHGRNCLNRGSEA